MTRILITAFFTIFLPIQAAPQTGLGAVEGTVMRHGKNEPLVNARVTIGKPSVALPTTIPFQNWLGSLTILQTEIHTVTDYRGRFAFLNLAPGDYIVTTDADGYRNLATHPGAPPQYSDYAKRVTLRPGEHLGDLGLSLVPLNKIGGLVRGPNGQPVAGVNASIGTIEYSGGRRTWDQVEVTQTNDRGEYQFIGLRNGEYYVFVDSNPNGKTSPFLPAYFPNALNIASAISISVTSGTDIRADIDLPTKPANWRTISGKVLNGVLVRETPSAGIVPVPDAVNLIPRGDDLILNSPAPYLSAPVDESGEFQIKDVAPGPYDLYATSRQRRLAYLGHIAVNVQDRDITGLRVTFDKRSAEVVSGKIVGENGATFHPESLVLRARTVTPFVSGDLHGVASPDGSMFTFTSVPPGTYDLTVRLNSTSGAYVADIRQSGRSIFESGLVPGDTSPEPVEVIVRYGGGAVNASVQGDRGRSGLLVLVPDAPLRENHHLYRDINVTAPASFTFEDVRPGNYKVFAIESWLYDPYQSAYLNADYLAKYEDQGVRVTVHDGVTLNVRVNLVGSSDGSP